MASLSRFSSRLPWDGAAARRALLLALAATLSFAIASLLHVHNAYWAAMPVWVIAQPARGVLLERAVFRVIGTLLGAAVGFALVHLPVSPYLQVLMLALWLALNAWAVHWLRGVHGYGALLAGITAAVVVLPSLMVPSGAMALALARVDCTLIGVIVGSAVIAFQTPESPLAQFYDEVRAVSAQAVSYAAHVLRGEPVDDGREERRILKQISQLEHSGRLHAAGRVEGYRRLGDVDLLVVSSLSTMAAAHAIRDGHRRFDDSLLERLEAIADHLSTAWTQPLQQDQSHIPTFGDPDLLRLAGAIGDLLAADAALASGPGRAYASRPSAAWLAPHREWGMAGRAAAVTAVASSGAMVLALASGAPFMGLAALGVCIFVMVLSSMPLPQLVASKIVAGVALGVLTAVCYRLVLQPGLGTPTGVVLSLFPFMLVGGLLRSHPRFSPLGLDFSMCFLLASQVGRPASHDLPRLLLDASALVVSAGLMACLFIFRPRQVHHHAEAVVGLIRRDLLRILESGAAQDPVRWRAQGSRQILRLALHLGRAKEVGRRWPRGLLATLNLGQAMIDLQAQGMAEATKALLVATLQQRLAPQAAGQALAALGKVEGQDQAHRLTLRLADTLVQASDLLSLGWPVKARPVG